MKAKYWYSRMTNAEVIIIVYIHINEIILRLWGITELLIKEDRKHTLVKKKKLDQDNASLESYRHFVPRNDSLYKFLYFGQP